MAQNSSKNGSNRYARAQPSSEKSSRPAFMSGLVIGALIMYFFPLINESSPSDAAAAVNEIVEKADLKELKFDFYTLLKETEILVPDDQDSANTADPEKDAVYVLQAGSFKNIRDAENLKVELLLMNLSAESESVKSKNGDIWHRVLVGPFTGTSKMASARAKLAENNIDSLKLKRKQ
ncbi:MAG: SPOR domain-containing protein [Porticoccaceae bacterium]|nr:SPOR domain-containing protein [Porticoccaceae bacterium]